MKKVRAVQIDLLKELERICNKYNIKYFANGGTLLGAVRHHGYIPWDDDIDVMMTREDFDTLLIHKDEFKSPYFLQTPYTDKNGFFDTCFKLRNSETTGCMPQDLYLKINNGIFIDIFVLDCVPDNKKLRKKFLRKVLRKGIFTIYLPYYFRKLTANIFKKDRKITNRYLEKYKRRYTKYTSLCAKYNNSKQKNYSTVSFVHPKLKFPLYPIKAFEKQSNVKFEFTTVSIPYMYTEAILREDYGNNYMIPLKEPSLHGKLYLDAEVPYKSFKNNKIYKNYKF